MAPFNSAAPARHNGGQIIDAAVHTESATPSLAQQQPGESRQQLKLRRGETLSRLLRRAGAEPRSAASAIRALADVIDMRRLKSGQPFDVVRDASGALTRVEMRAAFDRLAVARRVADAPDRFKAEETTVPTLTLTRFVEGTIENSLYLSAREAGMPDPVIVDLIRLMSFDVDFQRDIRRGDRFAIFFERRYAPRFGDVENGHILMAQLNMDRANLEAIWFDDGDGNGGYFDREGRSTRKTLMKTPVDGARLSSRFGARKHPILGYTRMHKGVDFAAPRGTPIMAAGNGVIEMSRRYGGFGNYVRIRHGNAYKTAYAHMQKFGPGIREGRRVEQGDIIGYVGTTGRSTGPHLHYEILRGGRQVNPLTLKLPNGKRLQGETLARFMTRRDRVLATVDSLRESQFVRAAELLPPLAPERPGLGARLASANPGANSNDGDDRHLDMD
ncbi:M23 family metallopeptidase [Yunchengibacter salinarum]|uniref:M23 family metallopeptidase n=1 Tax=Yunchengibacter salinarum TaxID=3133399 RepID=UPI0035B68ABB